MALHRRDFLKLSSAGLALGTLAPLLECPFMRAPLKAAMMGTTDKKMLLIFLRGGADTLNMIIPHGDSDYNDTVASRPTLYVPEEDAIDLNGFASANPNLTEMVDEIPSDDIAYLHRVGYPALSRSHFDGQIFWEAALPGDNGYDQVGWVNRLLESHEDLSELAFPSASVAPNHQYMFRGPHPNAHVPSVSSYRLGSGDFGDKLLGAAPSGGDNGSGLVGVYSRDADASAYDQLVRTQGIALGSSLGVVGDVDPDAYEPEEGADYLFNGNANQFMNELRDAVQLLKETECRVAGLDLGGFDTHAAQVGGFNNLLSLVSHAMTTVYKDTEPGGLWDDLVVVTMTEFGRTSQENGSNGTDHGEATCMMVAGGGVNGGVYNCDSSTWSDGDILSTPVAFPRYLAHLTDFRTVLAEIVDKHFDGEEILDDVIPYWDDMSGSEFDYLDFLE